MDAKYFWISLVEDTFKLKNIYKIQIIGVISVQRVKTKVGHVYCTIQARDSETQFQVGENLNKIDNIVKKG